MAVKTRAGKDPCEQNPMWIFTTKEVEDYLQQRFDALVEIIRKSGQQQDDVEITVLTAECSNKFYPFTLLMPLSVLQNKSKKRKNELSIFNPDQSDRVARMKDLFWKLVGAFLYDKDDENSFFTNTTRSNLGISLNMAHTLKRNRIPKIQKMNKGRDEYVVCMIDPIRIFHDMATNPDNPNEKFEIDITGKVEKIKSGNYRYRIVKRRPGGPKSKKSLNIEEILAHEVNENLKR